METPREHIANALQMLKALPESRVVARSFLISGIDRDAVIRRLNAALTLLDQQESK